MAEFKWDWDDFNGGYCVSHSDINQPKNTWKGWNVSIADDDGTIVPVYAPSQITLTGDRVTSGVISFGSSSTVWSDPTYINGYVVITAVYSNTASVFFINTETGVVTERVLESPSGSPYTAYNPGSPPVCVSYVSNNAVDAYVVIGDANVYKVTTSAAGTTVINVDSTPGNLSGLVLWNARMIAWSDIWDKISFSEPLDFINWPALNYISAGYTDDGVSQVVPRNMDLVVVKPSGWFSITGVLGVSAAVRQMNDTLGIFPADPIDQHNNVVYFTTNTGYTDYAVNLYQMVGGRVDIAAFQRFGLGDSNSRITKTNMGFLTITALTDDPSGSTYCTAYVMNLLNRWEVLKIDRVMSGSVKPRFVFARGQVNRYRANLNSDRYIYMVEATGGNGSDNRLALIRVKPNTVEPGQNANYSPSEGVVRLSNIYTDRAFSIKDIYVEAEMLQIPTVGNMHAYTGSASISCYVNNKSVSDIAFNDAKPSPTPSSTPYTFPFSTFTSETDSVTGQIRVMRFRVDNAAWMYGAEIELHFAGLKIRRVWLRGDTR